MSTSFETSDSSLETAAANSASTSSQRAPVKLRQVNRIGDGLVDRSRSLVFAFDGKRFTGHPGDTLASALLANGQALVGRSFKYHRPRGIMSAGVEEANALVEVGTDAMREPNVRATVQELYDGLIAASQNRRGSLHHDLMAINDMAAPILAAGFYYKTFMWPKAFWEKVYEPAIRHSAGLGTLSMQPDPDEYDKGTLFADLLVIGAGPAGLAAALAAGRCGSRVILCEEDFLFGGRLNAERQAVDGVSARVWVEQAAASLAAMDNVRMLRRTSVFGAYDHGVYGALQHLTDHLNPAAPDRGRCARQVLWRINASRTVLAAGATERHIAFPNNDRPGVMLAGAVRTYVNRFGVAPGRKVAVFTNNDDGWRTAIDLAAADIEVTAVIDTRDVPPPVDTGILQGARLVRGGAIVDTQGRHRLRALRLRGGQPIPTDCLAVSGGWNPNVHLSCHLRGRPEYRDEIAGFVPGGTLPAGMQVAGAACGDLSLGSALRSGHRTALDALAELGKVDAGEAGEVPGADDESTAVSAYWQVPVKPAGALKAWSRAWVDFQNDVTTKDVTLAVQEGFEEVEHVKRYTT
ncbi:MAG: FAD-dependent oxidoreductase, partial [Granulosicoccus sp.]|nr:FAD-dependent oxidoreductase [Granulosicoccus sp.]